ncbi:hypothetical protein TorRG33x02_186420 [Trema orientale]|uniref:Uncharacterized protein n=1 Tax=Trema orientale TaxID=63057 RepID=A0A2P5EJ35_TREOI|nr:hypothetical protein TorRG33x02_186420 [Trema orientale]
MFRSLNQTSMGKEILPIPKACCGEQRKKNVFGVSGGAAGGGWISLEAAGDLSSLGAAAAGGEEQARREMVGTVRKWERKVGLCVLKRRQGEGGTVLCVNGESESE